MMDPTDLVQNLAKKKWMLIEQPTTSRSPYPYCMLIEQPTIEYIQFCFCVPATQKDSICVLTYLQALMHYYSIGP